MLTRSILNRTRAWVFFCFIQNSFTLTLDRRATNKGELLPLRSHSSATLHKQCGLDIETIKCKYYWFSVCLGWAANLGSFWKSIIAFPNIFDNKNAVTRTIEIKFKAALLLLSSCQRCQSKYNFDWYCWYIWLQKCFYIKHYKPILRAVLLLSYSLCARANTALTADAGFLSTKMFWINQS